MLRLGYWMERMGSIYGMGIFGMMIFINFRFLVFFVFFEFIEVIYNF